MNLDFHVGHTAAQKIAFVGPVGVGKSTALRTLIDGDVVYTDVPMWNLEGLQDAPDKTTTTVGFDFGEMILAGQPVSVFGMPGQSRFDAVWQSILPHAEAVVLWLFGNGGRGARELRPWLDQLAPLVPPERLSVAVTRLDAGRSTEDQLQPYRDEMSGFNPLAPVVAADPRNPTDVALAVAMALAAVRYRRRS